MRIAGLLLAGGLGSRMGRERPKPLLEIGNTPMAEYVLRCLRAETETVVISTSDPASFSNFAEAKVRDRVPGHAGPLAGFDAAAFFLRSTRPDISHVLTAPADVPFLPPDFSRRMVARSADRIAVASRQGELQPTLALWPIDQLLELHHQLAPGRSPSIRAILDGRAIHRIEFPDDDAAPDGNPFFNVNTPDDFERARRHMESLDE